MTKPGSHKFLILQGFVAMLLVFCLLFQGCEDDPLLEAPAGASSGGSYGRLTIDKNSPADTVATDTLIEVQNPKVF